MRGEDASDLGKALGRRLAILRESRALSQSKLAWKANVSRSSLSLYEAGKKIPDLATLFRLLDALDYGLAALDRADELCAALRLTPRCRPSFGLADPLRAQVASLAAEAGNVVGRLADAVTLLASSEPFSEQIRTIASAEGYPFPEDRARAVEHWERIRKYSHEGRSAIIAELPDFHTWALSELLAHESAAAASDSAAAALELAQEALEVAERIPGDKARRSRSRGYALGFLGNAQRVQGDLDEANRSFLLSDEEWKAGEGCAGDLLDEARLLHLIASLQTAQRLLPKALTSLDQALAIGGLEMKGRLLIKKAMVYAKQDKLRRAVATLEKAEPHVDPKREPRLWLCLRHNLLDYLSKIGRFKEAEEMLPQVKLLSRKELDRIRLRWAEGRIAAGLGRPQQGIDLLTQVRAEFVSRTIWFDAALVTMELAVVFLRQGRTDMVKTLAVHLAPIFRSNGVQPEALAALTLFRKAAEQEKATLDLAERLVAFLRKAQHDPELKFQSG
ncbi:MAG TPA: helix-turn-helix domain-containing protein, partial [Thermoanaerobaculia bacterium]|nr:helix-turn-helix domain-containing protein [Thermoanaerobaculia bacterium]